jgi:hypothetical protein
LQACVDLATHWTVETLNPNQMRKHVSTAA